jgi:hypothetical protein
MSPRTQLVPISEPNPIKFARFVASTTQIDNQPKNDEGDEDQDFEAEVVGLKF